MKKSIKRKDIKILSLYINNLRKLHINSAIEILYNYHSFIICLKNKDEYLKFRQQVGKIFFKINKKYLKHLSRYIIFDCLSNFYPNDEVKNYYLSSGYVKDITKLFPNADKVIEDEKFTISAVSISKYTPSSNSLSIYSLSRLSDSREEFIYINGSNNDYAFNGGYIIVGNVAMPPKVKSDLYINSIKGVTDDWGQDLIREQRKNYESQGYKTTISTFK